MTTTQSTRTQNPVRFRKARTDGRIATLLARIQADYGLPADSFMFVLPNGRKMRSDATVKHLRKVWEQHQRKKTREN